MKKGIQTNSVIFCVSGMLILLFLIVSCQENATKNESVDVAAEKAEINKVVDGYAKAYETEDAELLSSIMAHDTDRISLGTDSDEYFIGWDPIIKRFKGHFGDLSDTNILIKDRKIKVHESGKVAWFTQIWDMKMLSRGQPVHDVGMRLTGILEKRNDKWLIVHYHNSFAR